jgi:predicted nucleic acid-binding protein
VSLDGAVERVLHRLSTAQVEALAAMLMEVLYSARSGSAAQEELEDLKATYEFELIDEDVWQLAIQTQVELAQVGRGYQRRGPRCSRPGLVPPPRLPAGK